MSPPAPSLFLPLQHNYILLLNESRERFVLVPTCPLSRFVSAGHSPAARLPIHGSIRFCMLACLPAHTYSHLPLSRPSACLFTWSQPQDQSLPLLRLRGPAEGLPFLAAARAPAALLPVRGIAPKPNAGSHTCAAATATARLCPRPTAPLGPSRYKVHVSNAFLVAPTWAAAVFLAYIRLMRRDYLEAARLIKGCHTDMPLSEGDVWIVRQLNNTMDDKHPGAHACIQQRLPCSRARVSTSGSQRVQQQFAPRS